MSEAPPAPALRLAVRVSSDQLQPGRVVEVEAQWLGEARRLRLLDDGAGGDGDQPADGVFVGELRGARPTLLPIAVAVREGPGAEARPVWSGVFRPMAEHDQLHLRLIDGPAGLGAVEALAAPPGQRADAREAAWTAASFGWALFVLAVCVALAVLGRGRS